MNTKLKRFLSMLLVFVMVFSMMPANAETTATDTDVIVDENPVVTEETPVEDPVAKIGDKEYATLTKAFEAAVHGDTIVLLKDVDEVVRLSVAEADTVPSITLDLNGKTWDCGYGTRINAVILTIKNGTIGTRRWELVTGDTVDVFYFGGHSKYPSTMELTGVTFNAELRVNNMAPSDEELELLRSTRSAGKAANATTVIIHNGQFDVVTVQNAAYLTIYGGYFSGIHAEEGAVVDDLRESSDEPTGTTTEDGSTTEDVVVVKTVHIKTLDELNYVRSESGVTITFVDYTSVDAMPSMKFTAGANSTTFTVQRLDGDKWVTVSTNPGTSTIEHFFTEPATVTFRCDWDNNGTYDRLVVLVKAPVAKVGDKYYTSIDEAVAAWTDGTTLTILTDATVNLGAALTTLADTETSLDGGNITAAEGESALVIASGNVILNVNADTTLTGGKGGAGIYVAEGASVTITGTGTLTAIGNGGVDTSDSGAAGIGGTYANGNSGTIIIDGATVVAKGYGVHGSGIGSGSGKVVGEIKIINGANVTAYGGYYAEGAGTKLQSSYGKSDPEGGAAIGGGGKTASTIANITITDSTVVAYGGSKAAGIGANFWSNCGTITISGDSNVTAQGGSSSAGIGTSRAGDAGVTANIVISGGTVTATGGAYGAGIGGGYNANSLGNGADASALPEISVTISGGTITATGGEGGAGIGGGYKTDNIDIDITGGTVTAKAVDLVSGKTIDNGGEACAIGSGANGSGVFENSPAVEIADAATVTAITVDGGKVAIEGDTDENWDALENVTVVVGPVAKVGDQVYYTIDEALAVWTHGKTLTLLADVTLSDVYTFNSTESRILQLGTYTLTAAPGKHAIEIKCNGQGTATYGLRVYADAENPGGITATGKSCIYYRKSGTTKDRVIIEINGGIFNGSYAINVYSSNRGTNCPQVTINGGTFNANVNIGHGKLIASGGTFNGWVNCTGDSTAYRQISGGTYKAWQFMTADASNKFWVGTSLANYNVGLYVNEDGYLVVGGPVITDDNQDGSYALSTTYPAWSSYLQYSVVPTTGLFYKTGTTVDLVKVFTSTASSTSDQTLNLYEPLTLSGNINVKNNLTLGLGNYEIGDPTFVLTKPGMVLTSDTELLNVTTNVSGYVVTTTVNAEGKYEYTVAEAVAQIGDTMFGTLDEAFEAAVDGDEVKILAAGTYSLNTSGKNITITGAVDGVVFDNIGAKNMGGADVTFNNVTFDYYPNVNYTGLQHSGDLTYNNCTFNGQVFLYGTSETFTGCTFNQNSADAYNVWLYSAADVEFTGCTFNSAGKSVLLYHENANTANIVTVVDCDFIASAPVEGKAAIEIDTSLMTGTVSKVTIDAATTATGFAEGSISGETLWNDKKNQTNIEVWVAGEQVWPIFVAQIGDTKYLTLDEAFEAAVDGDEVEILVAGTYELTTSGKNITITGAVDGVVFDNIGAKNMGGASVTFNNVTFDYATGSTYKGLQHSGNLTYNNCTINGQVFLYGASETFTNCTFNTTDANNYNVWTYGADNVTFSGCTFNCAGKSVLLYTEGANDQTNLTVVDCDFIASAPVEGKAAIEIDTSLMTGTVSKVTIDAATTATGFAEGSISGETLWNDKKNQTNIEVWVAGEQVWPIFVATVTDTAGNVTKFVTLEAAAAAAQAGDTITLLADVSVASIDVTDVTVDLNNTTLTLTAGGSNFYGNSTIKNGTINISGCVASGDCIIGIGDYSNSATLTLNNVNITGDGYDSAYAVLYVYNSSTLNINGGSIVVSNDNGGSGGVIKAQKGADGKINITGTESDPVELTFTNAMIGFLDGTVVMNYVDLDITGGANAINQSALTVRNSTLTIKDCNGRALTLKDGDVVIENSTLDFSGATEGEIRFKSALTLKVIGDTDIVACDIWTDAAGAKVVDAYGMEFTVTGTETAPDSVEVVDGKLILPPIMVIYADGTVEYFSDMLAAVPYTTNYPKLEGATVKLLDNIEAAGIRMMENDMVLDLNGFTYTIVAGTGSQGTNTSGFQIRPEVTTVATIKNGTIKVAEGAPVVWMFNNYATDFVVKDVIVDCTNMDWSYGESCYVHVSRSGDNTQFTGTTQILYFNAEAAGAAINVGGTMTAADTVELGGTVELDNGATLTAREGLNVVASDSNYVVSYSNGVYSVIARVASVTDAEGNVTYYATIAEAIKAAEAGELVTIYAGDYTENVSVNKAITVVGETDEEGNNLVNITGKLSVSGSDVTVKNLNVSNPSGNAGGISGGNILIEGCNLTGSNGLRSCYANNGDVTIKNCVITGGTYGVHFDAGNGEGDVIIDGCTITGWTSFGSAIEGVTISNTTFMDGNYDQLRFYQDATVTNCTFPETMSIDFGKEEVTANFNDCTVENASGVADVVYLGDIVEMGVKVYVDGELLVVAAMVTNADGEKGYYLTLAEAIEAAQSGETVTILTEGPHKLPGFSKDLTIEAAEGVAAAIDMPSAVNLRGSNVVFNGLTFNYTTNANYIGLQEVASETYNNCVINGQMFAYGNPANFTDCEFNQTSTGAYNIWTYGADNATFTNCDFNSAGKAMLIYNEGDCSPNVTVTGCTFTASESVDGKAAIEIDTSLMKTGKTLITITDTTATGFAAGSVSGEMLWNDKKDLTNLDVYVDGEHVWPIFVAQIGETQYTSLQSAIDAAEAGDTVTVLKDIVLEQGVTIASDDSITLDLAGFTVSMTDASTEASALITNNGTLKITGEGKLSYKATAPNTGYSTSTIINNGSLTVDNGTFENTTPAGGASYVIDNYNTLTVNGGSFSATRIVLRQAQFGNYNNTVTIYGGTFTGYAGLQMHVFSAAKETNATINGGTFNGTYAFYTSFSAAGTSANTKIVVNDGTFTGDSALFLYNSKTGAYDNAFDAEVKGGYFDGEVYIYANNAEGTSVDLPVITGGTYTIEPAETIIADGYIAQDNGNGTWTVIEGEWVAQIGETKYASLDAAFAAAVDGDEVEILVAGTYALTTSGKNITITGAVDGVVFDNIGAKNMGGASVIFNNVTFNYASNSTYKGLQHSGDLTYTNCTFNGQVFLYGTSETFTNCTFNTTDANNYNVWLYSAADVEFTGCTFNSAGKSVLLYHESPNVANNVTVVDCDFIASAPVEGKAAIEIDTSLMTGTVSKVTIDAETTATGFAEGSISGETLWNDKKNQTNIEVWVDDVQVWPIFVATVTDTEGNVTKFVTLEAAVAAAQDGETVTLLDNITLTDVMNIEKAITLDLGGKTLTGADGAIVLNIKADTTIKNGTITGNKSGTTSGLIDIYADLTMEGVTVTTSKINALRFKAGECTATLTDCTVTGAFKGYGGSVWNIQSGTYMAASTAISDQLNGSAAISGGTFHYEIEETECAPGYTVVDNGDGTWTVKYAPACFIDANNNGVLDEGEAVYASLEPVFANHTEGDVYVVLTADIAAKNQVDTDVDAHYYFSTNVAGGAKMDFQFADDWNYVQKMTVGENITLTAPYLLAWTELNINGKVDTGYAYFMGADVTVAEGAELNVTTGEATVQVKSGANLTVNGTVNASTINVWVGEAKLTVSGANAKVDASWIDIWDGTPSVVVENGATLTADNMKASRGGTITVDAATLDVVVELGHNGESKGEMTILNDGTIAGANLTTLDSTVTGPEGLTTITTDIADHKVVYEEGVYKVAPKTYVAETLGVKYETLAEALEAAEGESNIVVNLLADATLDITAWDTLAIGGDATSTITINGNGNTLTFNKLNSDWNHVATNNGAKLILNNMTINDSGYNNGPWNRYDIVFASPVELNNVTSSKALAFKANATLNDVTVNESGDNYAIWIQPNGQTVSIDGLDVNSAGRGIKIDEQYVDAAVVNLTVKNADFDTAKKGAILVKSSVGANITVENVDISGVAADPTNVVWNDEDAAVHYGKVKVNGGTKIQEGDFAVAIIKDAEVWAYYKTLPEAVEAVLDGESIELVADVELTEAYALPKSVTLETKDNTLTGELQLNAVELVLTSSDADLNVTTTVEDYKVVYEEGVYKLVEKVYVAQIGEAKYETLTEAIEAAQAGETIEFLADITEDVTVNKNVNINGAEFQYTGTMTISTGKTVTVENVNFVKGCITEGKGTSGNLTVKNCDFDGVDNSIAYAVTMRGGAAVTLEGCTVKNYDYGMLYVPSAVSNVTVKDVTAEGFNYGVHVAYGVNVTLENVKLTNVAYGIMTQNYGAKTITVKNSELDGANAIFVWERNTTVVDTFKFEGANTATALPTSTQAKLILVDVNSTLTAPEGFDVTTEVEGYKVVYEDGMYKVVEIVYVAQIGDVKYETLQEAADAAVNGDTIVLLTDITEDVVVEQKPDVKITIDGAGKTLNGTITVDGKSARYPTAGLTIQDVNFVAETISKDAFINLGGTNTTRYTSNVTITNCTFTADPRNEGIVAIKQYTGGCKNLTVAGCTATGVHSLIQLKNVDEGLSITGCTITDSKNGVSVGNSVNATISGCTMDVDGYGIRADGNIANKLTVSDCTITAEMPIVVRKTTAAYELAISGTNELIAGNTEGYQVIFTNDDDGTYVEPTGAFEYTADEANAELKVFPKYVAVNDGVKYTTFEAALAAAQANADDKTIVLLQPVEITADTTYDLTGVTVTSDGDAFIVTGGTLTLNGDGVVEAGNDGVGTANAIWANGGNVVINGGTYSVGGDTAYAGTDHQNDTIYTKNGGTVTINGGTFLNNGEVWTLNQNDSTGGAITVTGGTFYGWNPADNVSEGEGTSFVADGYVAEDNGNGSWTVVPDDKFYFYAAQVVAGNSLDMMFAFRQDELDDWTGHYVQITREFGDGTEPEVTTVPFEDWGTSGKYYTVTYTDLAAKEMSDQLTLVVCNADGEEVSYPWIDSMRAYAMRMLEKATNDEARTLFVDMLNYGAAAQTHFGYNTGDLANNQLTAEQKAYASTPKAMAAGLDQGDKHVGSNLITKSNIQFWVAIKGMTTDMYAVVEYTSHHPYDRSITIQGSEFGLLAGVYYLNIDELVCADARQVLTITVYNADGSVYTTCQESIEDYLARQSSLSDVYQKAMQFFDSCYAYLH